MAKAAHSQRTGNLESGSRNRSRSGRKFSFSQRLGDYWRLRARLAALQHLDHLHERWGVVTATILGMASIMTARLRGSALVPQLRVASPHGAVMFLHRIIGRIHNVSQWTRTSTLDKRHRDTSTGSQRERLQGIEVAAWLALLTGLGAARGDTFKRH